MSEGYQIVDRADSPSPLDPKKLAEVLAKEGQFLLPIVDLIENAQAAIDDLIDVMGRATIEAVLLMSAAQVAGPKRQGKKTGRDVVYHGSQKGRVALKERQLRVDKPRLRKREPEPGESGEVEVPAYEAMRKDNRLADRMLDILINGVSTRRYEQVLPDMADTVGVSKSEISRRRSRPANACSRNSPKAIARNSTSSRSGSTGFLGSYHVICAVGVDDKGHKHVLGIREGTLRGAARPDLHREQQAVRGGGPRRRGGRRAGGRRALPDHVRRPGDRRARVRRHGRRRGEGLRRAQGPVLGRDDAGPGLRRRAGRAGVADRSRGGNGSTPELTAGQLEVAVLDRNRDHRKFRRIRGSRLEELAAEARSAGATPAGSAEGEAASGSTDPEPPAAS